MSNVELRPQFPFLTDPKRNAPNLFTFLEVAGLPPTNNHAEQSLRLPVIFRKIAFGSQSLRGAQALATNLSLITTAKRHGRHPLELIKTVLLKAGDPPLDALYDPDCLSKRLLVSEPESAKRLLPTPSLPNYLALQLTQLAMK